MNQLEPCTNCEEWVELIDLKVPDDAAKLGFVRLTRCSECGDEVLHPPEVMDDISRR